MKKKCHLCEREFKYDELSDKGTINTTVLEKLRQVVVDGEHSIPLFSFPADKRRIVKESLIKFECNECSAHRGAN